MSENQEINLNFDHKTIKEQMIELLNQFEYVDKSYKGDVAYAKPEHSRHLRKIYNKLNDIVNTHYKNLPKDYETYNKTVPKEEKEKIVKTIKNTPKTPKNNIKNTNNTKKNNKNLKGGNNQENDNNDENISFLTTQKIINNTDNNVKNTNNNIFEKNSSSSKNYNIDDTLISIMDETDNNKENKIYEEIKELFKKISKSIPNDKIKNDLNYLNSYKDKIKIFLDKIKNNINNFQNQKYKNELKNFYEPCKNLYDNFEKRYYLSYQ